ncbi:MAG: histidine phosphatase family protein [Alphaproteobacteria bacterium]
MATVVFVRHGETDWNREQRLQGQKDIPLNELGRSQAKRNGKALIAALPGVADFDFVASPLSRTRETMEIARSAMGLPVGEYRLDARLKEVTFGDWEGHTLADIERDFPGELAARDADKWRFVPPEGESYQRLEVRVAPFLAELTGPTVVVAHGGVGRIFRIRLLGEDPMESVATTIRHDQVLIWQNGKGRLV